MSRDAASRIAAALLLAVCAGSAVPAAAATKAPPVEIRIGYLKWGVEHVTLSLYDQPAADDGLAGARLAVADNNTTGSFTGQSFALVEKTVTSTAEALAAQAELAAAGVTLVVAEVPAETVLALADASGAPDQLIFNVAAPEDSLREADCRADVVHVTPTYSMLADGLAQYLVWKRWPRWFLLSGALPKDELWADALKAAATKFGGQVVEERVYSSTDTARRTDSGHIQVQQQLPVFTQNAPEHDVVVVADESDVFGAYIPFRTWEAKPVAGSAGLMPTSWNPNHEQWGAMQMQSRFAKFAGRPMSARDADAWTAVRIVGEAATRAKTGDAAAIRAYVLGPKLEVAAFKGQKLTIRPWNHQLRQPILLTDTRTLVSVSPQEGFLHAVTELDTLGVDQPETKCRLPK
ncbi:ABC transporter substrate-binding protein [Oharaeibacter diazotrophicus]|uniref:Amino acid/amide ABC transporter substrate-binding protein (HAAT family) n=1 Tax=Oharaeibacter diazotrophicus TaxID=1920512 RepID=A0A4R6RF30_9HYPH|nr:ABC transporter substrate-binding protein [Oharaeibacter diazotrophicus]TDP84951.1 amino acid/amide ABC transporter substrate-binding protein (HAAT family) [Oharaeibacter diazotrophicus]BBE73921.1 hypothetical protein OHA_1_03545 [Pleomorphomonas sp. SM30]GLS76394.1 ABC transporter substrate-binding protein [Oharaeibacter diazotrophicus]